jgi:hypothetical protein
MVTGQKAQLFYQNTAMFYYIFMIQKLLHYWMSSRYSFLFVFSFLLAIGRDGIILFVFALFTLLKL